MQNLIEKFRKSSIVFEKPGILSEKLKTLTSSNYHSAENFLLKFLTCQCLQKDVWDFFLDFQLFAKIRKGLVSTHSQKPVFTFLLITQDLYTKFKKSETCFCRYWLSWECMQNVSKKY